MAIVLFVPATPSAFPLAGGDSDEEKKSDAGLAMKTTPTNDTRLPILSIFVKGSLSKNEQTQHVRLGARNVMTVASASGKYMSESVRRVSRSAIVYVGTSVLLAVHPKHTPEAS